jgi:hypothetical protein
LFTWQPCCRIAQTRSVNKLKNDALPAGGLWWQTREAG